MKGLKRLLGQSFSEGIEYDHLSFDDVIAVRVMNVEVAQIREGFDPPPAGMRAARPEDSVVILLDTVRQLADSHTASRSGPADVDNYLVRTPKGREATGESTNIGPFTINRQFRSNVQQILKYM